MSPLMSISDWKCNMSLTRQQLLEPPLTVVPVDLPDGEVSYIRKLNEGELAFYEAELFDEKGKVTPERLQSQRRRLLVQSVCDENGQRLFEPEEHELLKGMDSDVAYSLHEAAYALSVKREKDSKAIDKAEKKSEGATE